MHFRKLQFVTNCCLGNNGRRGENDSVCRKGESLPIFQQSGRRAETSWKGDCGYTTGPNSDAKNAKRRAEEAAQAGPVAKKPRSRFLGGALLNGDSDEEEEHHGTRELNNFQAGRRMSPHLTGGRQEQLLSQFCPGV